MTGITWDQAITKWMAFMRASSCSPATIEQRSYQLRRVADALEGLPGDVSTDQLVDWLSAQAWKPNTRRGFRGALRAFYSWGVSVGAWSLSPAAALPVVRVPRALPRPTPEAGYRLAVAIADPRARLAIRLAGACGLRRGEVARRRREDVEVDLLGWSLRVVGKGGHQRVVPLPDDLAREILAMPAGWLFPSSRTGRHLTPHHLGKLVAAELPETFTTHSLRHRCGTVAYAETRDLRAVQELLGHAKPETTMLYTEVPGSAIRAAVEAAA